ncbi:MAG TPA: hypothetical protein VNW97_20945 [Candidatus Saccharimonadales bacterium]|nr:hypothetical protein [Candidatus Saccharimonadales bacterium]
MPKHESMNVRFKVGDPEDEGKAYLSTLESGPRTNSVLSDKALFSINLKRGTTPAEVQELCRHLNRYAESISITWIQP